MLQKGLRDGMSFGYTGHANLLHISTGGQF